MTEVHRYKAVKMLSEAGNRISYDPHGPDVVMAEAYDQLRAENEALRKDAERYRVLRQADVDTIHNGGLFAGLTPDNIVINGHDLDRRTDAVIAAHKEVQP
ncbi:hypothetical protein [Pseudomonas sp. ABFPK]|uniref:hypothetical protein n=1 Tax=Pseudomonas sp. ABFPK TaxID=1636605 RepID=UPI000778A2F1|nr:hypothetical protein [Pseudomonas sp. ABFPK]KYC17045.1 hypothetical protein WM94_23355 [Pseudomonas sp. ABFPK]